MMIQKYLLMIACLPVVSLSACAPGALLKSDEPRQITYSLRSTPQEASTLSGPTKIVQVAKPVLPTGFTGSRIALYMDDGRKLDYYAAAEWPGPLDSVIEEFTHSTLNATLPSIMTVSPSDSIDADYRLQLNVIDFQPIYGTNFDVPPQLLTKIKFTLIGLPSERIISNFTLNRNDIASSARRDVVINELQSQLQSIETAAFIKIAPLLKQQETSVSEVPSQ